MEDGKEKKAATGSTDDAGSSDTSPGTTTTTTTTTTPPTITSSSSSSSSPKTTTITSSSPGITTASPSTGTTTTSPGTKTTTQANAQNQEPVDAITKTAQAHAQKSKIHAANLSASKDRFVLGSAAAMSILDLTLLADIIKNESGTSMYVPLLVLVSGAIALQVVIGILSLMISNVTGYFNQFKRDRGNCWKYLCCGKQIGRDQGNCCKNLCCFCCGCKPEVNAGGGTDANKPSVTADDATDANRTPKKISESESVVVVVANEMKTDSLDPMSIYDRKRPQKPQLNGLQACLYKTFESEVAAVVAKNNIAYIDKIISSTEPKLTPPQDQDPDGSEDAKKVTSEEGDSTNSKKGAAESTGSPPHAFRKLSLSLETVTKLEEERERQRHLVRKFEIDQERVGVYKKKFEEVEEEKFMERKLYWQNIINYIAYSVVVLNAFIAALKPLADSESDDVSLPTESPLLPTTNL